MCRTEQSGTGRQLQFGLAECIDGGAAYKYLNLPEVGDVGEQCQCALCTSSSPLGVVSARCKFKQDHKLFCSF